LSIQVDVNKNDASKKFEGLTSLLAMQALDVRDSSENPRFLNIFFEHQRNQMILSGVSGRARGGAK